MNARSSRKACLVHDRHAGIVVSGTHSSLMPQLSDGSMYIAPCVSSENP
ncbi:MAG: hypothetical protein IKO72_13255 [Kiritimatiellae bacterium]|nr:hypothetical protein [Kiritimatiellia bacterium]